eukprot:m.146136 g.146136  ORF g.146136 m.146136 type:complete len:99 (-) comp16075_c0_seq2:312-608(-)
MGNFWFKMVCRFSLFWVSRVNPFHRSCTQEIGYSFCWSFGLNPPFFFLLLLFGSHVAGFFFVSFGAAWAGFPLLHDEVASVAVVFFLRLLVWFNMQVK